MNKLKISYIQSGLVWENSGANIANFDAIIQSITNSNVIVLPEMFNTGFTMNAKNLAQNMNGLAVSWMKETAAKKNSLIIGSIIINDGNKYYNRMVLAYPDSSICSYDKRHLFRMGNEHKTFESGSRADIFTYLNWRIRPLICYDLRFPVFSRNQNNYDLLIYVANWPAPRSEVWKTLLKARAIENQCFVIGVNRTGTDGEGINYSGDSMAINPRGEIINDSGTSINKVQTVSLSLNELNSFREKFPVHLDADNFKLLD